MLYVHFDPGSIFEAYSILHSCVVVSGLFGDKTASLSKVLLPQ